MPFRSDSLTWCLIVILILLTADLLVIYLHLRKKHEGLKADYDKRNLLLNSIAEGVYGLDLNGNCTFCNVATLKLLGYKRETELVGRNIHELIHHTHADGSFYDAADCRACLAYKEDTEVHLENEVLWRADGTWFHAEYWAYPVRKGKELVGAVVSFVDITERKESEARLIAANRELDAFVYTVSHDLRTPICAIAGYIDYLLETHRAELPEEVVKLLGTVESQGERMAVLVDDLLALATVGTLPPPDGPINTGDELAYVLSELKSEIEGAGANIVVGELPEVTIPGTLLVQIFQNLVGNALRYAGAQGSPIEVGGECLGERIRLYVRDHGKGVPAGELENIFEVFYRGEAGRSLVGSGVGLATVRKIARLYGGEAWAEETPGGGATFWVEMRQDLCRA
jgi:PAS domain S-box-containing protein